MQRHFGSRIPKSQPHSKRDSGEPFGLCDHVGYCLRTSSARNPDVTLECTYMNNRGDARSTHEQRLQGGVFAERYRDCPADPVDAVESDSPVYAVSLALCAR